ncbi:nitric oxide dioxygenase [Virgibacillus phasianinus]|uniref:Flavohemoprotein n=1 Tax=Virgibacillus phasianinus TaxID=2017483 RepID=A0A220U3L6_9BACI|nr:NO-inducible flavohemoprotein [Virgibacillus phasianinus]ASK62645.1 nitric oxide dioxygenase [Virgibacillus phasianinus]
MATETKTGLDQQTIDIIKATVPVLEEHGTEITKVFYQRMFEGHPELKNIFNQTNQRKGDQSKALAGAVYAAAYNIDKLETILPTVKQISQKHKSLNIQPEHYPIVGKYLLLAMKEVLGDAADDAVIGAWERAYGVIASVFIETEKSMYKEMTDTVGGWTGFRNFKVIKKVKESDVITSFYFEPADNNPFPSYQAGQYITVKAEIEGEPHVHLRQYSLSCAPDEGYYRISVKREDAINHQPAGIVSNYLHETLDVGSILPITAPSGDFVLNQTDDRPLVLMSGGVGLTPMMSMLETVVKQQPEREVYFIHAAQSGNVHAMRDAVKEITDNSSHVSSFVIYDRPTNEDKLMNNHDKEGYIDEEWLTSVLPSYDANFYFCGPAPFMRAMYQLLKGRQVEDCNINYEFFGPASSITG